jgi:hypothetical protein
VDLEDVIKSLSTFEPLINSNLQYPYVFLNNDPFTEEFKKAVMDYLGQYRKDPKAKFSTIPKEVFNSPFNNKLALGLPILHQPDTSC